MNYVTPLAIPEGKEGEWSIEHVVKPPGERLPLSLPRTAFFGQPVRKPVVFDQATRWHRLLEGGNVWMTDYPVEQKQCIDLLKGFKGDVVVGGLGIGFALSVLARRPAVRKITVVEIQPEVVELVWRHVDTRKATLVVVDLAEYLKGDVRHDCGFYDIWASDGEGTFHETVVPLRKLSVGKVGRVACWNEDIMRGQLRHGAMTVVWMLEGRFPGLDLPKGVPMPWEAGPTIWHNWRVPFFKWWKTRQPDEKLALEGVGYYCEFYGTFDFDKRWEIFMELHK